MEEIDWELIYTHWPELFDPPQSDAISHVIFTTTTPGEVDDLTAAFRRVFGVRRLDGNAVQALWLEAMESYHRARVVGNLAVFDQEAASSGKLRLIWFDGQMDVVRKARVGVEHARELAPFNYGDSLKNRQFRAWWDDPTNVKFGPVYAFRF
jgi:hypothetical protein